MARSIDIVIPIYGQPEWVKKCVESVLRTTKEARLILVDDCSPGKEIGNLFSIWKNNKHIVLTKTLSNLGFLGACLHGASLCKNQYVLFLNSDIEAIKSGWLEKMIPEKDDIAVVGAKLVYPSGLPGPLSGKVQHAGVARHANLTPYHPFLGWSPDSSEVNESRFVNAVTGACFLVSRSVWDGMQGWDRQFGKGVYEDVDFCWRVRKVGLKILYQAESCLIHHSSISEDNKGRGLLYKHSGKNLEWLKEKWGTLSSDEDIYFGKKTLRRWELARKQLDLVEQCFRQDNFALSFAHVKKALKLAPDLPDALFKYAQFLSFYDKHKEAVEYLEQTVKLAPSYWDARLQLVDEWIALENIEKAKLELAQIQFVVPSYPGVTEREKDL